MYVACPSCKSLYAISAEQLRLAEGQVRCGQCGSLFDATNAVFDDPRQALEYQPPLQQQLADEIDELVDRALDSVPGAAAQQPVEMDTTPPAHEPAGAAVSPLAAQAGQDFYAQPVSGEFVSGARAGGHAGEEGQEAEEHGVYELSEALLFHDEPRHESHTRWGAIAAAVFLTLTLLAQYAWWDRNRLAQVAALRPALEWLCKPLSCDLPLRHDLAQMEMVRREVRDHPNDPDALLISAEFVNRAPYRQAYPVLQVSFSDMSGTPVAVRRFTPAEYLRGKDPARGMAPGEQALAMLEVVDPGPRAVSFQFDFM